MTSGYGRPSFGITALALIMPLAVAMPSTSAQAGEPNEHLTGDWGGARTHLEERGIEVGVIYIGETFSNLSGGLKRSTSYEARVDLTIETDLDKLVGWRGGRTHLRVFNIHNSGDFANNLVGALADPSNIDAYATTRFFTIWFQQDFGKAGSIRIGQLAADDEFIHASTAAGLINATFGWASLLASNLPSGGASYPLAAPGVRAQVNFSENFTLLAGAFSGNPAGDCPPDKNPQKCNKYGTTFSFEGGTFWISEAQYLVNQDEEAQGLAAAYKIGAWYNTGNFADKRYGRDTSGDRVSLADPSSVRDLYHDGNWGIYGIADQMLWRDEDSSVSVFMRGGGTPSDRNLISWYIDGGFGIKGPLQGRKDDTLTFGVAHAHISRDIAGLDRDTAFFSGSPYPVRSGETALELSYEMHMRPWWIVQPDMQYIIRPGGGNPRPGDSSRRVGNAFLLGVRTTIDF